MSNYLHYLGTFYQEETTFKLCVIIIVSIVPSIFLFISMHSHAIRVRSKFDAQILKPYHCARFKSALLYLFCNVSSLVIAYPICYDSSEAPTSVIMESLAVVLCYRALLELLRLEAGRVILIHLYGYGMAPIIVIAHHCEIIIGVGLITIVFICSVIFCLIYNSRVGNPYAQRYFGIKSVYNLID